MKGRSRENRPALRDHLGQYEERERGEHPDGEKNPQEEGRMTCTKHQTDSADGPSDDRDPGRCAKEVRCVVQRRPQSIAAAWLIQFSEAARRMRQNDEDWSAATSSCGSGATAGGPAPDFHQGCAATAAAHDLRAATAAAAVAARDRDQPGRHLRRSPTGGEGRPDSVGASGSTSSPSTCSSAESGSEYPGTPAPHRLRSARRSSGPRAARC